MKRKLNTLFLILLLCSSLNSFGQFHPWVNNFESSYAQNRYPRCLTLDSSGNSYAIVQFMDSLRINQNVVYSKSEGVQYAFIKLSNKGKCIWMKQFFSRKKGARFFINDVNTLNDKKILIYGHFLSGPSVKLSPSDSIKSSDNAIDFTTGFYAQFDSAGNYETSMKLYEGIEYNTANNFNSFRQVALDSKKNLFLILTLGNDTGFVYSKKGKTKVGNMHKGDHIIVKYTPNFDSIAWYQNLKQDTGDLYISRINIGRDDHLYICGAFRYKVKLGKTFYSNTINNYPKAIFVVLSPDGNIMRSKLLNEDLDQVDFLSDIVAYDTNHIFFTGIVRDSILHSKKWYSSIGKKASGSGNSFPFFCSYSFSKGIKWLQLTANKDSINISPSPYYRNGNGGICKMDKLGNIYTSFDQINKLVRVGGLTDPTNGATRFVKFDSLGNALWLRTVPSIQDFQIDSKYNLLYIGTYVDSILLHPFNLKAYSHPNNGFIAKTGDYQINRGNVFSGPYCAGDTINIPYTKLGEFNDGNYFIAELSDENGNFNGSELELGRIKTIKDSLVPGRLPMFQISSSGNYRIRIRSTSPVIQSFYKADTLRLLIYSRDKADPGPPVTICYGDTLQLNTYGGTKWIWSPKYKMNDSSLRQPLVWPQITTTYKIIIADSSGCGAPDTAFKMIKVNRPLKINLAFTDTALCENSLLKIKTDFIGGDSSNYQWQWYYINSPKSWFLMKKGQLKQKDTLSYFPSVDSITTEKLAIVLNDNCTNKKDTAFVIIRLQKPINITANLRDTVLCNGNIFKQQAKASGENPLNYQWQWKDLTRNTILSLNDSLSLKATQTSKIQLILKNGCLSDTNEFTLFVNPPLKGSILYSKGSLHDTTLCFGKNLKLFSSGKGGIGSGYSFKWYLDKTLLSNADTLNFVTTNLYSPGGGSKTLKLVLADNCTSGSDSVSRRINVIAGPQANFSWTKTCSKSKVPFTFTGSVAALPVTTKYSWHYPDGDSSVVQNPSKLLSKVGKNLVSLILRSSNGCSDVLTKEVDVKQEAIAQFTAADVCEDSAVNFINTSQDAIDYEWKFGDGQSDTSQSPKHLYLISGVTSTFNVTLIANVPAGCSDTFTGAVTINANPKSDFNFTTGGNQVNFTAVEIGASNYQWTFGDGGTTNTNTQTTQYTYSKFPSGKYTACLKVSNIAGCNSQTCKEINITAASNPIIKQQGIKIYPNPNTGSFTVETNEAKGNLSIEIYDAIGQIVHKLETFQSSTTLNLKLAEGIYLVRVMNESEVYLERVVIRR
jgi:hypothetical protein